MDARKAFWIAAVALLPLFVSLSSDFGATWDEPQQHAKAHHLIDYWTGRGPLEVPIDGAHLYGAPLDIVAALLERPGGADPYVIRHRVIAVAGWLGVLLTGLLAMRLFSPAHGLLAMTLLAVNPRYVADAMNNPKDLPFATAATALLLVMTYVSVRPPFLGWRTAAVFALVLGSAINVRAGALLFLGYLAVLLGFRLLSMGRPTIPAALDAGLKLTAILLGAIAIGWVTWPWAYGDPLTAPFRGLRELSQFGWNWLVLFDGREYPGNALPASYVPVWFWLMLSPVTIVGLAATLPGVRSPEAQGPLIALWAVVLFPLAFVVGTRATLYDALRHLLFVVPPLTVLAAAGWLWLWRTRAGPLRPLVAAALIAGVGEPLLFQWRNHPHQVAYVQPLAGGPRAAFARYDLDYWGNCLFEAMARIEAERAGRVTYVTGWPMIVLQADVGRFPSLRLVDEDDPRAEYFLRIARGTRQWLLETDARKDLRRVETADSALLCYVEKLPRANRETSP